MEESCNSPCLLPDWLNQEFLQKALRSGFSQDWLSISSCNFKRATNVGDNYLSQVFRANANVVSKKTSTKNVSVIIKIMPEEEQMKKYVNEANLFMHEAEMLAETLPLMQTILDERGVGRKLFPDMYFSQKSPNYVIVLEDLCESGFQTASRFEGLDMAHSTLVLETLAVFHAVSLAAVERDQTIKNKNGFSFWHRPNEETAKPLVLEGLESLAERLEAWGNWPSDLPHKIRNLKSSAFKRLYNSTDKDDEFNVVIHGNSWTSNFMFKYSDNVPVEMRFLDFQFSCYCSPLYDLLFFVFSSPQNKFKISHLDDFIKIYYRKLIENCQSIGYPINLTFVDLKEGFRKRLFFGFIIALVVFPCATQPPPNDFLEENIKPNSMYLTDTFKEGMEQVLPYFIKHNLFD